MVGTHHHKINMQELPEEILRTICQEVHKTRRSYLTSLCLVSRRFYTAATPLLYQDIEYIAPKSFRRLLSTLLSSPHLIEFVRKFKIYPSNEHGEAIVYDTANLDKKVIEVLSYCTNLTTVICSYTSSPAIFKAILQLPALESLNLSCDQLPFSSEINLKFPLLNSITFRSIDGGNAAKFLPLLLQRQVQIRKSLRKKYHHPRRQEKSLTFEQEENGEENEEEEEHTGKDINIVDFDVNSDLYEDEYDDLRFIQAHEIQPLKYMTICGYYQLKYCRQGLSNDLQLSSLYICGLDISDDKILLLLDAVQSTLKSLTLEEVQISSRFFAHAAPYLTNLESLSTLLPIHLYITEEFEEFIYDFFDSMSTCLLPNTPKLEQLYIYSNTLLYQTPSVPDFFFQSLGHCTNLKRLWLMGLFTCPTSLTQIPSHVPLKHLLIDIDTDSSNNYQILMNSLDLSNLKYLYALHILNNEPGPFGRLKTLDLDTRRFSKAKEYFPESCAEKLYNNISSPSLCYVGLKNRIYTVRVNNQGSKFVVSNQRWWLSYL